MRTYITLLLLCIGLSAFSQSTPSDSLVKKSFIYSVKDTVSLGLDVYSRPAPEMEPAAGRPCVIFVFGGAFIGGHRDDTIYRKYFDQLTENGIVVVSISYRLGLKGVKHVSAWRIAPLRHAIDMAVEDVYDATSWTIGHAAQLGIDTGKIMLSGSSSGAVTVLTADCRRSNAEWPSGIIPPGFRYAGVIAFSGAILRTGSGLHYNAAPAPTLLFHGTADRIVPYNKIRFLNRGLYGSSAIARTLKSGHYPYSIYREDGRGHEVAVTPMYERMSEILSDIRELVIAGHRVEKDTWYHDGNVRPVLTLTAKELMNRLRR